MPELRIGLVAAVSAAVATESVPAITALRNSLRISALALSPPIRASSVEITTVALALRGSSSVAVKARSKTGFSSASVVSVAVIAVTLTAKLVRNGRRAV